MTSSDNITPFLRWAGGKRWLASHLAPLLKVILNSRGGSYWEPFLGSGAMFFALAPQKAVLSDLNQELIETYYWVKNSPDKLIEKIRQWPVDSSTYYHIRQQDSMLGLDQAARLLYLNRTCYGGLYRTNQQGVFNTPFGGGSRTTEILWRDNLLERAASCLRSDVELKSCDFGEILESAKQGDIVYCDPTYSDVRRGQFDRYGSLIYSWADQERLAEAAFVAFQRGVTVLVSNGAFPELHSLYPAAYRILLRKAKSIGCAATNKKVHEEYLFILDPQGQKNIWEKIAPVENRRILTGI